MILTGLVELSSKLGLARDRQSLVREVLIIDVEDDGTWRLAPGPDGKPAVFELETCDVFGSRSSGYKPQPFADVAKYMFPCGKKRDKLLEAVLEQVEDYRDLVGDQATDALQRYYASSPMVDKIDNTRYAFRYRGTVLVSVPGVIERWTETGRAKTTKTSGLWYRDAVTGQQGVVAYTLDRLRKEKDKVSRVSFNCTSWTYGRRGLLIGGKRCRQSENALISERSANHLAAADAYLYQHCVRFAGLEFNVWTEEGFDDVSQIVQDIAVSKTPCLWMDQVRASLDSGASYRIAISRPVKGRLITIMYETISARRLLEQLESVFQGRVVLTVADLSRGSADYFVQLWRAIVQGSFKQATSQIGDLVARQIVIDFSLPKPEVRQQMDYITLVNYHVGRARYMAQRLQTVVNGRQRTNSVIETEVSHSEMDRWAVIADRALARHDGSEPEERTGGLQYVPAMYGEFARLLAMTASCEVFDPTVITVGYRHQERWWRMPRPKDVQTTV